MINLEILRHIWNMLPQPQDPFSPIEVRELDTVHTINGHPFLTVDVQGRRHLLLPILSIEGLKEDKRSAGIHITFNHWGDGDMRRPFVDVICVKPHLNTLFDMVLLEILVLCESSVDEPDKAALVVLDKWRELLERERSMLPDRQTLIGIWGELAILLRMVAYNSKVISTWQGPTGGRYDFSIGKEAIEIKTSLGRKGRFATINGIGQLEAPMNGRLHLAYLQVEEVPQSGHNISDLVKKLLDIGCDRLSLFSALGKLGLYSDVIPECDDFRLRSVELRLYLVDENFPRIIPESFLTQKLPRGVIDISYKIDLSTEPPRPLPKNNMDEVFKQFAEAVL